MQRLTTLLLLVLALGGTDAAAQEKYPAKPVKVVVPFGPGDRRIDFGADGDGR